MAGNQDVIFHVRGLFKKSLWNIHKKLNNVGVLNDKIL